jgi:hypothetical protein
MYEEVKTVAMNRTACRKLTHQPCYEEDGTNDGMKYAGGFDLFTILTLWKYCQKKEYITLPLFPFP